MSANPIDIFASVGRASAIDQAMEQMLQYFAHRGVTEAEFSKRFATRIELINPDNAQWYRRHQHSHANVAGRWGMAFTFLDPNGKPYLKDGVPYKFVRWLGEPTGIGVDPAKVPKGSGPYGRPSCLHFPPLDQGTYAEAATQGGKSLIHNESFVKAEIVYLKTGELSCGSSGVYGFSAKKRGIEYLYKFLDIDFAAFKNIILFDSNSETNSDVRAAQHLLAYHLRFTSKCPEVFEARLPKQSDGEDWGPDDFLAERGTLALQQVLGGATPWVSEPYAELIERVNERAVYVRKISKVVVLPDRLLKSVHDARNDLAPIKLQPPADKNNKIPQPIGGFDKWMASDLRNQVDDVVYRYLGPDRIVKDNTEHLNLYLPSGPWPVGGYDYTLSREVREAVRTVIGNDEDTALFWKYLRFLKFTDRKPVVYLILYSEKRGIGKGWLDALCRAVIGPRNARNVGAQDFAGGFNSILQNTRYLGVNEFKCDPRLRDEVREGIKNFVGDKNIRGEAKFVDAREVEANAGLLITTNALSDVPTDGLEDRRAVPICCDDGPKWIGPQWESAWKRMHDLVDDLSGDEGREVMNDLVAWLRDEVEEQDFSAWRPPIDQKRIRQMAEGMSPVAVAALQFRQHCEERDESTGQPRWRAKRCFTSAQLKTTIQRKYGIELQFMGAPATFAKQLRAAGWVSSSAARIGDEAKDWRVGEGKTRTDSGVWFPGAAACQGDDGAKVSSAEAGDHAHRDFEDVKFKF